MKMPVALFFIGLFAGGFIGITIMCMCITAGNADRHIKNTERMTDGKDKKTENTDK